VAGARADPAAAPAGTSTVQALGAFAVEVVVPATPLRGANGLACADRRLFVASAVGDAIAEVRADGGVVPLAVPPELAAPDDLAFAANGDLLATAMRSGAVWRRDPGGRWERLAGALPGANGIAVAADGRVFVSQCFFGDAIVEMEPGSARSPREVARDLGCPNGFFVEPSGALVVPLLEKGEVVRLDPRSGAATALASGLASPTAVEPERDGAVLVLEGATGAILRLEPPGGETTAAPRKMAQLSPGLDNLAFCGESLLVSNFLTGAIHAFRPWPGEARVLVEGGLVMPRGILSRPGEVLVTDGVSLKRVRGREISVLFAVMLDPLPFPVGLAGDGDTVFVSAPESGSVHRLDLASRSIELVADALEWPTSVAVTATGDLLVAETGAGRVVRITASGQRETLAGGLLSPLGLAIHGERVFTAEPAGGRVLALRAGEAPAIVASELSWPAGLAVDEQGRLLVVEGATGRLVRIGSGGAVPIASGLAVGPSASSAPLPIAVAAEPGGSVLVASPVDGSVIRLAER
jgi:sugar lactone lactonase YvrE